MARRRGQLVSDTTTVTTTPGSSFDEQVAQDLLERARREGVSLVGPGGLLAGLTKTVLETALEAELTDHLGYEKHDPAGRNGANSRNGTRAKRVITEVGPVELEVPRDREGSFEPRIVPKRARRLDGVDELVISLVAKGLTTGEVQAHLAEVYGAEVSRETISKITDGVLERMAEWQSRPLERVYPVLFIDAIFVKVRDGQVANRPIYVAVGVTVDGERDILGLWAGTGGEGAKYWAAGPHRDQEPGHRGRLHRRLRRPRRPARRHRGHLAASDHPDLRAAPAAETASATPPSATGRPSPGTSNPSTRPPPPRRRGSGWPSSPPPGRTATPPS